MNIIKQIIDIGKFERAIDIARVNDTDIIMEMSKVTGEMIMEKLTALYDFELQEMETNRLNQIMGVPIILDNTLPIGEVKFFQEIDVQKSET